MAPERPAGSPRAANYFLNLVTDSPPIRHSCEKFVILFENLPECRFSFKMSSSDPLTCGDASCLTPCHLRFVSNSCHFFGAMHGHPLSAANSWSQPASALMRPLVRHSSRDAWGGSWPPDPAVTGRPTNHDRPTPLTCSWRP